MVKIAWKFWFKMMPFQIVHVAFYACIVIMKLTMKQWRHAWMFTNALLIVVNTILKGHYDYYLSLIKRTRLNMAKITLEEVLAAAYEMRNAQYCEQLTHSYYWADKARYLEKQFDNLIDWHFNDNHV